MSTPDLKPQTPGEPVANTSPLANAVSEANGGNPDANEGSTANAQAPLYVAKHVGRGRWVAVTNDDDATTVGDFIGDKESIQGEVDRLNDGGEPYVKPAQSSTANAHGDASASLEQREVDATSLKQAVMTKDGWLCPEPSAKKE